MRHTPTYIENLNKCAASVCKIEKILHDAEVSRKNKKSTISSYCDTFFKEIKKYIVQ